MRLALSLLLAGMMTVPALAQVAPSAFSMYDIAFNGTDVTIDADLDDWDDAQWIFFSQDEPNFLQPDGNPVFGVPESPADFSGFFAMKADDENLYFAVRVRDEGTPMIATDDTPNAAFNYDHFSVYLGLYDIGESSASPHVEAHGAEADDASNFQFLDSDTGDAFVGPGAGRSYRISPASDNSGTTLGPDYQIYTRALDYGGDGNVVTGDAVQTYNGGAVDSTIVGTTAATAFLLDADDAEVGYVMEWQVPLASLAGDITSRVSRAVFNGIEYPMFDPQDGDIIPFDFDVTDLDDGESIIFMRGGNMPALWRDAHNFGLRGRFVDLSTRADDELTSLFGGYFIDYKEDQTVTIDGATDDWLDARWVGFSQDEPNFLQPDGNPVFGVPESPADFSGFFAMKADDENLYFAVRVRDEGTPMIATDDTPNAAFNYDHFSTYLSLFNIGNLAGSPHVEAHGAEADDASNFQFLDPDTGDAFVGSGAGRSYRISPASDNSGTTLGPDYQIYTRALDYGGDGNVVTGDAVQTYNGGAVDSTIVGTTAATAFLLDADDAEVGYVMEWQVPLASLAGDITSRVSRAVFNGIDYPMFMPVVGDVIPFDYDVTDLDDGESIIFMRGGNMPALWRDAHNFGLRGLIVEGGTFVEANEVIVSEEGGPVASSTEIGSARPNPFSGVTQIAFAVSEATDVRLEVFNAIGQRVALLVDGPVVAGEHLATFDAAGLPAGIYISRLSSQGSVQVGKMVLVR